MGKFEVEVKQTWRILVEAENMREARAIGIDGPNTGLPCPIQIEVSVTEL